MLTRRKTLQLTASAKPAKIIVGFAAGGLADMCARIAAQGLTERLKQQFIVENRPGAATNIATEAVVRSPADGYTLLALAASASVNQSVYEKLSFNIITDLTMIAGTIISPLVFVANQSAPFSTIPEMIAYAKANPGKVLVGSFGTATTSHVALELFKMMSGVDIVHVPYRGGAPMLTDLMAGQVHCGIDAVATSLTHIRGGRLRPLAVCSLRRSLFLPDIPSMSEFIPEFEAVAWNAIAAPKGTPASIVNKLSSEITATFAEPTTSARVNELGGEVYRASPAELAARLTAEVSRWQKVAKFANIKPE
jgi:tripartite-type tricarboxylate transporter receptor subunit TctC